MDKEFRSGYAAIVGWPNVGKSTLLNAFLGFKLSIVSPKPQTTRDSILGIYNAPNAQLIFLDTPGWLQPSDSYQSFMKRAIMRSVYDDADVLLWVVEPRTPTADELGFGALLGRTGKPVIVINNKKDISKLSSLGDNAEVLIGAIGRPSPVIAVSAKTGEGIADLRNRVVSLLPVAPPFFPVDQVTDRWERYYVSELIRETIFKMYRDEVPHACLVAITDFTERPGRKDHIQATIWTETEGQQRIVIGPKGQSIKLLGQDARKEIEILLGRPVFLELTVKVRKHWRRDATFIASVEST